MSDVLGKLLTQSKEVRWFLIVVGAALTGIAGWGFVQSIQQGLSMGEAFKALPDQLVTMWTTAMGLIASGFSKIGEAIAPAVTTPSPTPVTVSQQDDVIPPVTPISTAP